MKKNSTNFSKSRRKIIKAGGSLAAVASLSALSGCSTAVSSGSSKGAHVVVVGGGFGGATVSKYIRMWSDKKIRVTLIEPKDNFVSCPISNLVIAGLKPISYITHSYSTLESKYGVRLVKDTVVAVDAEKKMVRTSKGDNISYDRLVMATGIGFDYSSLGALQTPEMQKRILHSWQAGPQTVALRKQLENMPNGGVYALSIPKAPYRCPPGPYERASLIAEYFKNHKPKSKVLILDANEKVKSKEKLFKKAWADLYPGMVEYRPDSELNDVAIEGGKISAIMEFETEKADVLNVIPPHEAGSLVINSGVKLLNNKWADVKWLTTESANIDGIHIIGDSAFPAPSMPKSGHMANQQAKVAAAAIINMFDGIEPNSSPMLMNTCYSFLAEDSAVHVASVHYYDHKTSTFQKVKGAGGLSDKRNALEPDYIHSWAANIWNDCLG